MINRGEILHEPIKPLFDFIIWYFLSENKIEILGSMSTIGGFWESLKMMVSVAGNFCIRTIWENFLFNGLMRQAWRPKVILNPISQKQGIAYLYFEKYSPIEDEMLISRA